MLKLKWTTAARFAFVFAPMEESIAVTRLVPGLDSSKRGITVTRAMATNVAGVFAAGDCTGKPYQLAKTVGEGNVAALSACEYIDAKEK